MYVYRREFFWLYSVTLVATDTAAECIIQSELLLYCSLWSSLYNCRKSRPYTEGIVSGVLDDNHLNVIKKPRFSILHSREKSRTSAAISNELKWIRCRRGFAVLSLWICWRRRFVLLVKYLSWNRKYVQTFTYSYYRRKYLQSNWPTHGRKALDGILHVNICTDGARSMGGKTSSLMHALIVTVFQVLAVKNTQNALKTVWRLNFRIMNAGFNYFRVRFVTKWAQPHCCTRMFRGYHEA